MTKKRIGIVAISHYHADGICPDDCQNPWKGKYMTSGYGASETNDRWSDHPCERCDGTGRTFYCAKCDVERPQDCLHEADPDYVDDAEDD